MCLSYQGELPSTVPLVCPVLQLEGGRILSPVLILCSWVIYSPNTRVSTTVLPRQGAGPIFMSVAVSEGQDQCFHSHDLTSSSPICQRWKEVGIKWKEGPIFHCPFYPVVDWGRGQLSKAYILPARSLSLFPHHQGHLYVAALERIRDIFPTCDEQKMGGIQSAECRRWQSRPRLSTWPLVATEVSSST